MNDRDKEHLYFFLTNWVDDYIRNNSLEPYEIWEEIENIASYKQVHPIDD